MCLSIRIAITFINVSLSQHFLSAKGTLSMAAKRRRESFSHVANYMKPNFFQGKEQKPNWEGIITGSVK